MMWKHMLEPVHCEEAGRISSPAASGVRLGVDHPPLTRPVPGPGARDVPVIFGSGCRVRRNERIIPRGAGRAFGHEALLGPGRGDTPPHARDPDTWVWG